MLLALLLAMLHPNVVAVTTQVTSAPSTTYRTTTVKRFESFGSNGTLTLWFDAKGYVHGNYVADDGGSTNMPVSGGRDGSKIWLDFAGIGLHVSGTIDAAGVLHCLGSKRNSTGQFVFTATPKT